MKNVLVTGAAGGMGRAACELLAKSGFRVWGLDRAEPQGEYAWRYVRADITDAASVEAAHCFGRGGQRRHRAYGRRV